MALNRLLPYRTLQTRNLRLLLLVARVFAWLGILLVAAGVAYAFTTAYLHFTQGPSGIRVTTMALTSVIGLCGYGLIALGFSGVLAALVGIEESQRRRVERD